MALVKPAAISHWSALHKHGMSDQIPRRVYVLTTNETSVPKERSQPPEDYHVQSMRFKFIQVTPARFFGTQPLWVGDSQVTITDPERTLLDGLERPRYCGDFSEVLHAFELYRDRIDLAKITQYARQLDGATAHRLGWVLEHVGLSRDQLHELADVPVRGYRVLDPSGIKHGPCNRYWKIQENLS